MIGDLEPLLDRVTPGVGGCWIFTGARSGGGYCRIKWHERTQAIHRVVYELIHGEIPDGLVIDHTCHNQSSCPGGWCPHRRCINPAHLETVTPAQNVDRSHLAMQARQFCPNGHEYTPENTYMVKSKGHNERRCLTCHRTNSLHGWRKRWAAMSEADKDAHRARKNALKAARRERLRSG